MKFVKAILGLCMILMMGVACSPNATDAPVYSVVSEGSLSDGATLPAPTEAVVLTVTGLIGTTNVEDRIEMDTPMLQSMRTVEYTVTDPFEKKEVVYQGILMSDLLDLWQVPAEATTLSVLALDDYQAEVPIEDLRNYPVIYAMQADGVPMPISTRGPAMFVFPYEHFEFDQQRYNDYWVWQIKSIEVK
ncbi:MAG: hypothetical protein ACOYLB_13445 [Phototrophicaceae bacterium]